MVVVLFALLLLLLGFLFFLDESVVLEEEKMLVTVGVPESILTAVSSLLLLYFGFTVALSSVARGKKLSTLVCPCIKSIEII